MEGGEGSNAMASVLRPRTINGEPSMMSFIYMSVHAIIVPISFTCFSYYTLCTEYMDVLYINFLMQLKHTVTTCKLQSVA